MSKISESRLARIERWARAKVTSRRETSEESDPAAGKPRWEHEENVSLRFLLGLGLTELEILALLDVCDTLAQLSRPDEWEAERALWLAAAQSGQESNEAAFKVAYESLSEEERELSDSLHRKVSEAIDEVFRWADDLPHERGPASFWSAWKKIDARIAKALKRGDGLRSCLDFDLFDPLQWRRVVSAAKNAICFGGR